MQLEAPDKEPTGPFYWDFEALRASMRPATRRNFDRHGKVTHWQICLYGAVPWMHWPVLNLVYDFWGSLMEEGIKGTCNPYWGMLAFSYMNDGMKPTIWHTWQQVMHPRGKYDGIYVGGAPHSKAEADGMAEGGAKDLPEF